MKNRSLKNVAGNLGWLVLLLMAGMTGVAGVAGDVFAQGQPRVGLLLMRAESGELRGGGGGGSRGRFSSPAVDVIESRLLAGTLDGYVPKAGAAFGDDKQWVWKKVELDEKGVAKERGLYLYVAVDRAEAGGVLLGTTGGEVYVNGEPRGGNVYGYPWVKLPVALHAGVNHLLIKAGRKSLNAQLVELEAVGVKRGAVALNDQDMTLPDLVLGEAYNAQAAVIVMNAGNAPTGDLTLIAKGPGFEAIETVVPSIGAGTLRKVGFLVKGVAPNVLTGKEKMTVVIELRDSQGNLHHAINAGFEVVGEHDRRRVTFVSQIDGSVQYYGLLKGLGDENQESQGAIILSCHGASVEARRQAGSHSAKQWFHVVAPTNRRPYGYDWEDIGRMDAMEVLDLAQASLSHNPLRTYVSGHSMGGHGTWHLASTYPDRFAAVGPSAGWISRSSYGRKRFEDEEASKVTELLDRSKSPQDTLARVNNLKHHGVYIVHGGDDDNVPVREARNMAQVLSDMHHDWDFHEEPGKRHWWSNELGDDGSACVEYPFMLDAFARHAIPPVATVRNIEFATAHPGINGKCHWLTIERQVHDMVTSHVNIMAWPNKRKFEGTTQNVRLLRFDAQHLNGQGDVTVMLDGQTISAVDAGDAAVLWLEKIAGVWHAVAKPSLNDKGSHRYGGIRDELGDRFVLVYGTKGGSKENAWAANKARFDAETFWYRGNGSVEVLTDAQFAAGDFKDRTVVFYGNADTNGAWKSLLGGSDVQVKRGLVTLGGRKLKGDDLSVMFVKPRPGSDVASVIVISGTGPVGMNGTNKQSLFGPAARYPDLVVRRGKDAVASGYFGWDWSVKEGEVAVE